MEMEAACCCGNLRIKTKGKPAINAICHCNNCKKRTGSAFGISVYFENSQIIEITGKSHIYKINNQSIQNRYFCPNCGTTLYWEVSQFPGKTGIAGGCFVENLPEPQYTVFNHNQFKWLMLPEHLSNEL